MDQKKELGKGIRALLGNMDANKAAHNTLQKNPLASIQLIPLQYIETNPSQPRVEFDAEPLRELADTIKALGVIQPITVRKISDLRYQIISGERRTRASRMAGLSEIPAFIRTADDQGMLEMALVENIQRENLNAMEVGISLARLMTECKLTHEQLSQRVGMERSTVSNYLRLLKLSPDIQQAVKSRLLSMGHARALAGVENLVLQTKLHKETLLHEWSVRKLEQTIKSYVQGGVAQKINSISKPIEHIDSGLKTYIDQSNNIFGRRTSIKSDNKGKGQIVIPFSSYKDLEELLNTLSS